MTLSTSLILEDYKKRVTFEPSVGWLKTTLCVAQWPSVRAQNRSLVLIARGDSDIFFVSPACFQFLSSVNRVPITMKPYAWLEQRLSRKMSEGRSPNREMRWRTTKSIRNNCALTLVWSGVVMAARSQLPSLVLHLHMMSTVESNFKKRRFTRLGEAKKSYGVSMQ